MWVVPTSAHKTQVEKDNLCGTIKVSLEMSMDLPPRHRCVNGGSTDDMDQG